jgi:ribosome-binding factor A
MSQRTERLDELLREEISAIIAREIADPRIGFVTVTRVDVDRELSHANVWVSVIGDQATRKGSIRALGRAMPFVRHRLGSLRLKRIPELHLREDDSAERVWHDPLDAGHEAVHPGHRIAADHGGRASQLLDREPDGQGEPERIRVGALVADDQDLARAQQPVDDRLRHRGDVVDRQRHERRVSGHGPAPRRVAACGVVCAARVRPAGVSALAVALRPARLP